VTSPLDDRGTRPLIGEWVVGLDVPAVNERAVRASAGILFLAGFSAWLYGLITGELNPMRAFGALFALEMYTRLFLGTRFTPTLLLGTLITRPQRPEWVEARTKRFAWGLGFGMALLGCLALGWLGLPAVIAQTVCGVCIAQLYVEAAFGYCLGCEVARRFSREKPTLCAGDTCTYVPPKRGEHHRLT
jgi:hypothetical protein